MDLQKLISLPLRYKPWVPLHFRLILENFKKPGKQPQLDHKTHLKAAIDWLCLAQDINGDGGVSAGWSFEDGWLPSYPETTGYIIETFLAAAKILDNNALVERANRMIDWELSLQMEDGAFPGHFGEPDSQPVIFNTGQIMHGMIAGYLQLNRPECLESAARAGYWLQNQQDDDGCWRKYEHNGVPHVYNTRATWALLSTALLAGEDRLKQGAVKNLDWALNHQTSCGWYKTNAFTPDKDPFTHTIAYAIRGFLESGVLLNDERYINSALNAARGMAKVLRQDGWLAGTYGDEWKSTSNYCCLTGVAQMSLNWARLAQDCGAHDLKEPAQRALDYLKSQQKLNDRNDTVRGAIAGSSPIWGDYSRFEFPNWATKFYADALMMDLINEPIPPVSTRFNNQGIIPHV
jgi:hypothetical protein